VHQVRYRDVRVQYRDVRGGQTVGEGRFEPRGSPRRNSTSSTPAASTRRRT